MVFTRKAEKRQGFVSTLGKFVQLGLNWHVLGVFVLAEKLFYLMELTTVSRDDRMCKSHKVLEHDCCDTTICT